MSEKLWSNHGPRIVASRYVIRFWEPPASRIFNPLPVAPVLSPRYQSGREHVRRILFRCSRVFDFMLRNFWRSDQARWLLVEIEANLGRLRFLRLGSILAPIKRSKLSRFSELSFVESTDSSGRSQP